LKDISSGKYIQLVNEVRALEAKQKGANIDEEAGGKGGKVNKRLNCDCKFKELLKYIVILSI